MGLSPRVLYEHSVQSFGILGLLPDDIVALVWVRPEIVEGAPGWFLIE